MITILPRVLHSITIEDDSLPDGFKIEIVTSYHKNKEYYEILLSNVNTSNKKIKVFKEGFPKSITNIHSNGIREIREITLDEIIAIVRNSFENNAKNYIIDYCINYMDRFYWKDYFPELAKEIKSAWLVVEPLFKEEYI